MEMDKVRKIIDALSIHTDPDAMPGLKAALLRICVFIPISMIPPLMGLVTRAKV